MYLLPSFFLRYLIFSRIAECRCSKRCSKQNNGAYQGLETFFSLLIELCQVLFDKLRVKFEKIVVTRCSRNLDNCRGSSAFITDTLSFECFQYLMEFNSSPGDLMELSPLFSDDKKVAEAAAVAQKLRKLITE